MYKTIITPKKSDVHISIPKDYIGREIEVLLYAKDELDEEKSTKDNNAAKFKGLLTKEEAGKYHRYLKKARTEWQRDI